LYVTKKKKKLLNLLLNVTCSDIGFSKIKLPDLTFALPKKTKQNKTKKKGQTQCNLLWSSMQMSIKWTIAFQNAIFGCLLMTTQLGNSHLFGLEF